jgi:hypothetical protein
MLPLSAISGLIYVTIIYVIREWVITLKKQTLMIKIIQSLTRGLIDESIVPL